MLFDNFTLFTASAIALVVMAAAFLTAARGRPDEPYWRSWFWANAVLATGILGYMAEPVLPDLLLVIFPNAMLVLGFGLRWRAAREFNRRAASPWVVFGPAALFVGLCAIPQVYAVYWEVFLAVNVALTWLALATAHEFWRDHEEACWSRYGLVFTYTFIGVSFAARIVQGVVEGGAMTQTLPDDLMLNIHLLVALVFTVGSGAFALTIAYERDAAHLKATAMRDALTGLSNRRAFDDYMHALLDADTPKPFALVLFDLDHFKKLNDAHGHAAGDEALKAFSSTATALLRQHDFLARIGGEEFAMIMADTNQHDALAAVERIWQAVGRIEIARGDVRFGLTVSAGVCNAAGYGGDYDGLMRAADRLLYAAKRGGRDRVVGKAA